MLNQSNMPTNDILALVTHNLPPLLCGAAADDADNADHTGVGQSALQDVLHGVLVLVARLRQERDNVSNASVSHFFEWGARDVARAAIFEQFCGNEQMFLSRPHIVSPRCSKILPKKLISDAPSLGLGRRVFV